MSTADGKPSAGGSPLKAAEVRSLFADLVDCPVLVLAVSGGPDSTALMVLAARWRRARKRGPRLVAVTVDHGLRPEARREALAVRRLARSIGVEHRTLCWTGPKPKTGLQHAARLARYRLLTQAAAAVGGRHVLTAHTLDDQAETVLMRLTRGSGLGGLAAMARIAPVPGSADIQLVRPLLDVPKSRLIATLRRAGIGFADDPSNRDPRFTRVRLRGLMPDLEREGLGPQGLVRLARRMRRADAALAAAVDQAWASLVPGPDGAQDGRWTGKAPVAFPAERYAQLPAEIGLRLLGSAIDRVGDEGPVELGKLEVLHADLVHTGRKVRFRRTLAGAVITQTGEHLTVERAPARRGPASKRP